MDRYRYLIRFDYEGRQGEPKSVEFWSKTLDGSALWRKAERIVEDYDWNGEISFIRQEKINDSWREI